MHSFRSRKARRSTAYDDGRLPEPIRRSAPPDGAADGTRSGDASAHADAENDPSAVLTAQRLPLFARVLMMLAAIALGVVFAAELSTVTLQPSVASESLTHTNLKPGDSIRSYLDQPELRDTVKQLGGNVLLGVPFGILLPVLAQPTRGLLRVTVATAFVMLVVELVQGTLVTGRAFDIDDVILNSSGALLGYLLLGRRLGRAMHPRRHHWWHRWTRRPEPGAPADA
ncbi:VanZ family protein [Streptomyces phytohabitans]|uniref:VanZ family protein n=1 Tax=Streptomyces phytohabitans TaxID=1150371 RepID=UPI00345BCDF2